MVTHCMRRYRSEKLRIRTLFKQCTSFSLKWVQENLLGSMTGLDRLILILNNLTAQEIDVLPGGRSSYTWSGMNLETPLIYGKLSQFLCRFNHHLNVFWSLSRSTYETVPPELTKRLHEQPEIQSEWWEMMNHIIRNMRLHITWIIEMIFTVLWKKLSCPVRNL